MEDFTEMLEKGKYLGEVIKLREFRYRFMLMVEGYLRLAGYTEIIAIMGHKFSFNLKSRKHTMAIFEIGIAPTCFHMIMYELAYINIKSMNLMASSEFKK